jgi:hypothetical protein
MWQKLNKLENFDFESRTDFGNPATNWRRPSGVREGGRWLWTDELQPRGWIVTATMSTSLEAASKGESLEAVDWGIAFGRKSASRQGSAWGAELELLAFKVRGRVLRQRLQAAESGVKSRQIRRPFHPDVQILRGVYIHVCGLIVNCFDMSSFPAFSEDINHILAEINPIHCSRLL